MDKAGIENHADLFNNALTLFEWSSKEVHSGRIIASLDESNMEYEQLSVPFLKQAAITSY